jgi:hypothetical protein
MTEQLNFFNKLKLLNNELLNDTLTSQQVLDIVNQLLQLDNKISNIEIEIKQLNVKNFKLYSKYNPTLSVDVDELDVKYVVEIINVGKVISLIREAFDVVKTFSDLLSLGQSSVRNDVKTKSEELFLSIDNVVKNLTTEEFNAKLKEAKNKLHDTNDVLIKI